MFEIKKEIIYRFTQDSVYFYCIIKMYDKIICSVAIMIYVFYCTSIAQLYSHNYIYTCFLVGKKLYAKTMLGDQPRGLLPRLAPLSTAEKKAHRKTGCAKLNSRRQLR